MASPTVLFLGLSGGWTVRLKICCIPNLYWEIRIPRDPGEKKNARLFLLQGPVSWLYKSYFWYHTYDFCNQHASHFINYYDRDLRDFYSELYYFHHNPSQTQTLNVWYIYLHLPYNNSQMEVNIPYIECLWK